MSNWNGEMSFYIGKKGMVACKEGYTIPISYSDIEKIYESDGYIIVYIKNNSTTRTVSTNKLSVSILIYLKLIII